MKMLDVVFSGKETVIVKGLYQYDYGQKLKFLDVEFPDGTEVDFYQGERSGIRYVDHNAVSIPDTLIALAAQITAYVYLRDGDAGETRKEIKLPVIHRPRPSNNIDPEEDKDYRRLLPMGVRQGMILVKTEDTPYSGEWKDPKIVVEGAIDPITDEEIENLFKD